MHLVICMAGLNTRFHDVGFDIPKYLLPWGDETILRIIIKELTKNYNFTGIYLLPNKRDIFFKARLVETVADLGIPSEHIVYIPDTKGQAHTAAIGAEVIAENANIDTPVAFHNSDTILENLDCEFAANKLAGDFCAYINVFPASSPQYSYIAMDSEQSVSRIVEKQVISPFASSGFYAFASSKTYLNAFNELNAQSQTYQKSEIYISDVLQVLVDQGKKVCCNRVIHGSNTIVLGSPEEYGIELAKKFLAGSSS